jgi:hypothetical protein
MRALARTVNVGSLGLWSAVLTLGMTVGLAGSGCIIIDDDRHDDEWEDDDGWVPPPDDGTNPPPSDPMLVTIDADKTISAEPGEGVGLFVEYAAGGTWRLWTSCDTNYSNVACAFDVVLSVDTASEITKVEGEDLEGFDEAGTYDEGSAFFVADTDSNLDAVVVHTTEGAILRVDMLLDGYPEARFIYWFGEDVLHQGAPSNPVDFEPSAP